MLGTMYIGVYIYIHFVKSGYITTDTLLLICISTSYSWQWSFHKREKLLVKEPFNLEFT